MYRLEPGLLFLVGAPGTGKTQLCIELIRNLDDMFTVRPQTVYFYYERYQTAYDSLPPEVKLEQGIPDSYPDGDSQLIVLDDLADLSEKSHSLYRLAAVHARHSNTYVICIKHNLFTADKYSRDLALSATYYALFENVRYSSQIVILARQVMPDRVKYFMDAYRKAISRYGYLFVDLRPRKDNRLMSDILSDEGPAVYERV